MCATRSTQKTAPHSINQRPRSGRRGTGVTATELLRVTRKFGSAAPPRHRHAAAGPRVHKDPHRRDHIMGSCGPETHAADTSPFRIASHYPGHCAGRRTELQCGPVGYPIAPCGLWRCMFLNTEPAFAPRLRMRPALPVVSPSVWMTSRTGCLWAKQTSFSAWGSKGLGLHRHA